MAARDLVGGDCAGNNDLKTFVHSVDQQPIDIPPQFREYGTDIARNYEPSQEQIEDYINNLENQPPIFQNDDEMNDFLNSPAYGDVPEMAWMNNFFTSQLPGSYGLSYEYQFSEYNHFTDHPDPFPLAYFFFIIFLAGIIFLHFFFLFFFSEFQRMELFKAKSLNDAILALEVVVQRDPQNSDAW